MKREEAIEILSRPFYMAKVPRDILEAHKMAVDVLEQEPIQPKAKVGKWISIYGNVKCSICGNVKDGRSVGKATHYCDFCGAKMEDEG